MEYCIANTKPKKKINNEKNGENNMTTVNKCIFQSLGGILNAVNTKLNKCWSLDLQYSKKTTDTTWS
jgi:hypothetical protein